MKTIKKIVHLPHTVDKVWVALTNAEALAEWLMPNTFREPVVGHEFRFQYDPDPICSSGIVNCRVKEVSEPNRMVWEWHNGPMKAGKPAPPAMQVEWILEPVENGTRLTLVQTGLKGQPWIIPFAMSVGWRIYLRKMLPQVLGNIKEGEFERGAIPLEKRLYKAKSIPPEVTI